MVAFRGMNLRSCQVSCKLTDPLGPYSRDNAWIHSAYKNQAPYGQSERWGREAWSWWALWACRGSRYRVLLPQLGRGMDPVSAFFLCRNHISFEQNTNSRENKEDVTDQDLFFARIEVTPQQKHASNLKKEAKCKHGLTPSLNNMDK